MKSDKLEGIQDLIESANKLTQYFNEGDELDDYSTVSSPTPKVNVGVKGILEDIASLVDNLIGKNEESLDVSKGILKSLGTLVSLISPIKESMPSRADLVRQENISETDSVEKSGDSTWVDTLLSGFKKLFPKKTAGGALEFLGLGSLANLSKSVKGLFSWITPMFKGLGKVLAPLGGFLLRGIKLFPKLLSGFSKLALPITAVVTAITGLYGGIKSLLNFEETFGEVVSGTWADKFSKYAIGFLSGALSKILNFFSFGLIDVSEKSIYRLLDSWLDIIKPFRDSVVSLVGWFIDRGTEVFDFFQQVFGKFYDSSMRIWKMLSEDIFNPMGEIFSILYDKSYNFFVGLWQEAMPYLEKAQGVVAVLIDGIVNFFGTIKTTVLGLIDWILEKIESTLGWVIGSVGDKIKSIRDDLKNSEVEVRPLPNQVSVRPSRLESPTLKKLVSESKKVKEPAPVTNITNNPVVINNNRTNSDQLVWAVQYGA